MNYAVRAVLHCPAIVAQTRLGSWAELQELPSGRCLFSMNTESLQWAAMALGRVEAELTEVEPPALFAVLQEWSERFTRAGQPSGTLPP
ncbi:MAG: Helix-turn-helix type 11 domain protein [Pseudonocardiales bacterium]|nr:Helix-turn-helix type 11 domain protein [Pseudonocardiales bacterium]